MREKPDVLVFTHVDARCAASRIARWSGGGHVGDRGLRLGGIKPAGHGTEPEPERIEFPGAVLVRSSAVLVSRPGLAQRRRLIRPCPGARRTVDSAFRWRVAVGLPYRDSGDQR